ncbi:MAG: hypothetical protein KBT46_05330 [Ruminococcus sp.]|nr:hypothetical protein [Candidatus Copronaster equi]
MSNLRLKGIAGNIPFDCPAEKPDWMTKMGLKEIIKDADGRIEAISYFVDCGHGFGEENKTKIIQIRPGEKVSFTHSYIDTSDGTWDDGCFTVAVELTDE